MPEPLFLRACWREEVERTPVWLMRQAGRYMRAYREMRRRHSFMELCKNPRLAAEITLQPVRAFGMDAAIIFSDILLIAEGMGVRLEYTRAGPRLEPLRTPEQVESLRVPDVSTQMPYLLEAIKLVKQKLGSTPLIGFAGAPFTLASYLIEGGTSRSFMQTKRLMFTSPGTFSELMRRLTDAVAELLNAQVEAGADALQVFDSWVGCLSPGDYERYVLPHMRELMSGIDARGEVPVIHFVNQAGGFLESVSRAGGDVIGVDWRVPIDIAWRRIGYGFGIQGNLDPMALFAPEHELELRVEEVLERAGARPGHIFNLGHGVHRATPERRVRLLVELVRRLSSRRAG